MFGTSMMLTIGQALEHARVTEASVRLCIGGEWLTGRVLHCDGHGLAVGADNGDTCVIRLDAVSCVRIPAAESAAPTETGEPEGTAAPEGTEGPIGTEAPEWTAQRVPSQAGKTVGLLDRHRVSSESTAGGPRG